MWVGDGVVVGVGWRCEGKGETQKRYFLVYVYYFKEIRQGRYSLIVYCFWVGRTCHLLLLVIIMHVGNENLLLLQS